MSEMQRDGSEMRCKRCGANECRIHGFCSVECEHYFDYEEEITDLNARIAELEAAQRWIPVSERLPEDTERMLTIVCDAFEDTTAISILQHYGDGDWFSWDSGRYVVTHWMPLPELPKECE